MERRSTRRNRNTNPNLTDSERRRAERDFWNQHVDPLQIERNEAIRLAKQFKNPPQHQTALTDVPSNTHTDSTMLYPTTVYDVKSPESGESSHHSPQGATALTHSQSQLHSATLSEGPISPETTNNTKPYVEGETIYFDDNLSDVMRTSVQGQGGPQANWVDPLGLNIDTQTTRQKMSLNWVVPDGLNKRLEEIDEKSIADFTSPGGGTGAMLVRLPALQPYYYTEHYLINLDTGEVFAQRHRLWYTTGLACKTRQFSPNEVDERIQRESVRYRRKLDEEEQTEVVPTKQDSTSYLALPTPIQAKKKAVLPNLPKLPDPGCFRSFTDVMQLQTRKNYLRDRRLAASSYILEYGATNMLITRGEYDEDQLKQRLRTVYGRAEAIKRNIDTSLTQDDFHRRKRNMRALGLPTRFPDPSRMDNSPTNKWINWINIEATRLQEEIEQEMKNVQDPDDPFNGTAGGVFQPLKYDVTDTALNTEEELQNEDTQVSDITREPNMLPLSQTLIDIGFDAAPENQQTLPSPKDPKAHRQLIPNIHTPEHLQDDNNLARRLPETPQTTNTRNSKEGAGEGVGSTNNKVQKQQNQPNQTERCETSHPPQQTTQTQPPLMQFPAATKAPYHNNQPHPAQNYAAQATGVDNKDNPHPTGNFQTKTTPYVNGEPYPTQSNYSYHVNNKWTDQIDKRSWNRRQNDQYVTRPSNRYRPQQWKHQYNREYDTEENSCERCGEEGHTQYYCSAYVQCDFCKTRTHNTIACNSYKNFVRSHPIASSRQTTPVNGNTLRGGNSTNLDKVLEENRIKQQLEANANLQELIDRQLQEAQQTLQQAANNSNPTGKREEIKHEQPQNQRTSVTRAIQTEEPPSAPRTQEKASTTSWEAATYEKQEKVRPMYVNYYYSHPPHHQKEYRSEGSETSLHYQPAKKCRDTSEHDTQVNIQPPPESAVIFQPWQTYPNIPIPNLNEPPPSKKLDQDTKNIDKQQVKEETMDNDNLVLKAVKGITEVLKEQLQFNTTETKNNARRNNELMEQLIKAQERRDLDPALLAIPTFSGKDPEQCGEWIQRVRNVCKQSGRSLRQELINKSDLTVQTFIQALDKEMPDDTIADRLMEYFSDIKTSTQALSKLKNMYQGTDESILLFNQKFRAVMERIDATCVDNIRSDLQINMYLECIKPSISKGIKGNRFYGNKYAPTTLGEAMKKAEEAYLKDVYVRGGNEDIDTQEQGHPEREVAVENVDTRGPNRWQRDGYKQNQNGYNEDRYRNYNAQRKPWNNSERSETSQHSQLPRGAYTQITVNPMQLDDKAFTAWIDRLIEAKKNRQNNVRRPFRNFRKPYNDTPDNTPQNNKHQLKQYIKPAPELNVEEIQKYYQCTYEDIEEAVDMYNLDVAECRST